VITVRIKYHKVSITYSFSFCCGRRGSGLDDVDVSSGILTELAHFEKKTFLKLFFIFIFLYEIMVLATYSLSIWVTLPLRLRHSTTPSEKRFVSVKCYPPMYKLNYGVPTVRCAGGAD